MTAGQGMDLCPRPDLRPTYMIYIALITEFTLAVAGVL
jgi:hypothetical protein